MPDITPAPRRRPLWRLFILPALLVVAAIAWSGFWFYAASEVGVRADAWRAQEAKAGRIYDCGKRSVAGYPFRLEVRCEDASVTLVSQTAGAGAPFTARLGEIMVIASIYQPKLLIAEFKAPATIADRGQPPSLKVSWSVGRSSVAGLPAVPERASIVFENPSIERVNGPVQTPLARANRVELHGRLAEGSSIADPVIQTALQISGGSIQELHPLLATPFESDVQTKLSGLKDFSPKPWPERFREMQAAGGKVEIVRSRIQQGELVAVAAGTLGLNAQGQIEGELQMTVTGLERVIPALGIDKMLEQGVPQATLDRVAPGVKSQDLTNLFGALDKAIPGLGKVVKQNTNVGVAVGINSLGTAAELEGKKARSFPLRFVDGAVFLGPLKVGQIPPLF
ncbi:DUF2125 domain-containing protein [Bradyrhizobium sp. AUGA SZCCT0240]|uniref:DUF2125 domain-containing protein n=1 Tax=unclassified Bradyrhizobium TaxID=2631580 RepID=UPI001BAD7283|nr:MULTISPECIES: DUF2125 domain-containing protein [unclassified Bradyrhizobium]MBR1193937.1 DUF2125 domain-containing protein [Bradyrhizobium sp. AUGA SZCCT0160]MBR1195546.1 DUF2125 domain-containing protein [Bradyrhizobium sp. AUGA SZCCT0158]MBR1244676.1 DUF2125 domain-containing protein [Bradyrhizobium sp. AUGA SZCCT0274]MBR1258812.1 DUF2125 domain-containing protein [Bradyrhizobium sp. AUGA SZCCT0240]